MSTDRLINERYMIGDRFTFSLSRGIFLKADDGSSRDVHEYALQLEIASSWSGLLGRNWCMGRLALELLVLWNTCILWCRSVGPLPFRRKGPKNAKQEITLAKSNSVYVEMLEHALENVRDV